MSDQFICDEWYVADSKAYFLTKWYSELFEVDIENKTISYLGRVPEKGVSFRSYARCIRRVSSVYCFPDVAKNIWKYDLKHEDWYCIQLDCFEDVRAGLYICGVEKDIVYMYSLGLGAILSFDMEKEVVIDIVSIDMLKDVTIGNRYVINERLYLSDANNPSIFAVDYRTGNTDLYAIPGVNGGIYALLVEGNTFWLCGKNRLYKWEKDSCSVEEYEFPRTRGLDGTNISSAVSQMIYQSGTLFLFPYFCNEIWYMNPHDSALQVLSEDFLDRPQEKYIEENTFVKLYADGREKLFFNSNVFSGFFELDTKMIKCDAMKLSLDLATFKKFSSERIRYEDDLLNVESLIKGLNFELKEVMGG